MPAPPKTAGPSPSTPRTGGGSSHVLLRHRRPAEPGGLEGLFARVVEARRGDQSVPEVEDPASSMSTAAPLARPRPRIMPKPRTPPPSSRISTSSSSRRPQASSDSSKKRLTASGPRYTVPSIAARSGTISTSVTQSALNHRAPRWLKASTARDAIPTFVSDIVRRVSPATIGHVHPLRPTASKASPAWGTGPNTRRDRRRDECMVKGQADLDPALPPRPQRPTAAPT